MRLDWLLNPLALYAALALGLVACLCVFFAAKAEVSRLRQASAQAREELANRMAELEATMAKRIAELESEVADLPAEQPASSPLRPCVNLTKRAQALRMRRRGESVESITAALAVPRNEVELLLKLQELVEARKN